MAIVITATREIEDALVAEGLVPEKCSQVDLLMPADGIVSLRYTVFVEGEAWARLARAFSRIADAKKTPPC